MASPHNSARIDPISIDTYPWDDYSERESVKDVKCSRTLLLLAMFGMVALACLVPLDSADTAFNETDTPPILSYATLPQVRLVSPTIGTRRVPDRSRRLSEIPNFPITYSREQHRHALRSSDRQKMLCVFLI